MEERFVNKDKASLCEQPDERENVGTAIPFTLQRNSADLAQRLRPNESVQSGRFQCFGFAFEKESRKLMKSRALDNFAPRLCKFANDVAAPIDIVPAGECQNGILLSLK